MFRPFIKAVRAKIYHPEKRLGWIPNPPDKRDYDIDMMGLSDNDEPSYSLRPYVINVLNQGSLASCAAHPAAYMVDILESKKGLSYSPISRLFLYYHSRRSHSKPVSDTGTYIRAIVKTLKKIGVPDEKYWPYVYRKVNRQPRGWEAYTMAHGRKNGEYFTIKDEGQYRVDAIKAAIRSGYPVMFGTQVTRDMLSKSGPTRIGPPTSRDKIAGGHAMTIVGFRGDDFEILNSWGEGWRDDGYCIFTRRYITESISRDFMIMRGWGRIR